MSKEMKGWKSEDLKQWKSKSDWRSWNYNYWTFKVLTKSVKLHKQGVEEINTENEREGGS